MDNSSTFSCSKVFFGPLKKIIIKTDSDLKVITWFSKNASHGLFRKYPSYGGFCVYIKENCVCQKKILKMKLQLNISKWHFEKYAFAKQCVFSHLSRVRQRQTRGVRSRKEIDREWPEEELKRDVNLELTGGDRRERGKEEGLVIDRSMARSAPARKIPLLLCFLGLILNNKNQLYLFFQRSPFSFSGPFRPVNTHFVNFFFAFPVWVSPNKITDHVKVKLIAGSKSIWYQFRI